MYRRPTRHQKQKEVRHAGRGIVRERFPESHIPPVCPGTLELRVKEHLNLPPGPFFPWVRSFPRNTGQTGSPRSCVSWGAPGTAPVLFLLFLHVIWGLRLSHLTASTEQLWKLLVSRIFCLQASLHRTSQTKESLQCPSLSLCQIALHYFPLSLFDYLKISHALISFAFWPFGSLSHASQSPGIVRTHWVFYFIYFQNRFHLIQLNTKAVISHLLQY